MKNTFTITNDQFLSDVADQLPKNPGIHLIVAKTGVGKTTHMMKSANENKGAVIFPVKAILAQQNIYKEEKSYDDVSIIQIEHIIDTDFDQFNELHIDEAQLCYTAGYRNAVEDLVELILDQSVRIPVYLYSATTDINMLPFSPNTVNFINKPFDRPLNVVQIVKDKTGGDVKSNTNAIATILETILANDKKPMLCFVNSADRMASVADFLKQSGYSSICIKSEKEKETRDIYNKMLKEKTVASAGVDVVLSTITLGEGIDFFDDFHCVSIQCEPGFTFQQLGRARKNATWWMITGTGTATVATTDTGRAFKHWTDEDGAKKSRELRPSSRLEVNCFWRNPEFAYRCNVFGMISGEYQKGDLGVNLINRISEFGYEIKDVYEFTDFIKRKKTYKSVSKKQLRAAIEKHGLPSSTRVKKHAFLDELHGYQRSVINRQIDKCNTWKSSWETVQTIGIEADTWEVFFNVKSTGRDWVMKACKDLNYLNVVKEHIAGFRESSIENKSKVYSGKAISMLSEIFWERLMPKSSEQYHFYNDGDEKMRDALFAYLVGFKKENSRWVYVCETPIMTSIDTTDVITRADQKRFNKRADRVILQGLTAEEIMAHAGITKKQFADLRLGELNNIMQDIKTAKTKQTNQTTKAVDVSGFTF